MMRHPLVLVFLAIAAPVLAQDMIGTSSSGQIYSFDSFTGSVNLLGNGLAGQHASCRDDHGRIWSTTATTLSVLDPTQPNATTPVPGLQTNLTGLANDGAQFLWGIEDGSPDVLVRIDKVAGSKVTIGATGFGNIEGLENHNGHLYAWDTTHGLLHLDKTTGVATDVNPALGTGGAQVAWLTTRMDGRLVGGQDALYLIDPQTGLATQYAYLGNLDLRGADPWHTYTRAIGSGCNGAFGQVSLQATVTGSNNKTVTLVSGNHAANSVGATIVGVSDSSSGGSSLPLLLDPNLGTIGCTLYTSTEFSMLAVTSASGPATLTLQATLPHVWSVAAFFAQQIVLEPVTGGVSLSNAVLVQIGN